MKSTIEERIKQANELIRKNPNNNHSNTKKWLKYWEKSYKNDFTCSRCKKKTPENFTHFLIDCEENESDIGTTK